MSNRGFLIANPQTRSKILAESKSFIPLFWLSLLSADDIVDAEENGIFLLDRTASIQRSEDSLPFVVSLFPEIASFNTIASSFLDVLKSKKCKTIGLNIAELLPDPDDERSASEPKLATAVRTIESRQADYTMTIPARTVQNPFTREETRLAKQVFESTPQMLLFVCMIDAEVLSSKDQDVVRNALIGHIWQ